MTTKKKEIEAFLKNLGYVQEKLKDAAGASVNVEMRMRLIGQFSEEVRRELKMQSNKVNYWNCKPEILEEAIYNVFGGRLTDTERKQIEQFRPLRNKLLHCDFVNLVRLLKIAPTGREIRFESSSRIELEQGDIKEAILSIDRNGGFETMRSKANAVIEILDKIIRWLAQEGIRDWLYDYIFYLPQWYKPVFLTSNFYDQ